MKTLKHFSHAWILNAVMLAALGMMCAVASADTVDAIYNSATDVPVTATSYTAAGNTVNFTLNFAPATGTDLMVVQNTGLDFIHGTFDNLAQGQAVALSYSGTTYNFVANYYGGSGNDLVLVWANNRAFAWGYNNYGELGDNTTTNRLLPVPVTPTGVLAGKTVVALAGGGGVADDHSLGLCSDGTLAAWGANGYGQAGDNTTTDRHVPVAVNTATGVSVLSNKMVVAIATGDDLSLALSSDGTVAAWGDNFFGGLGDNRLSGRQSTVPVSVNTGTNSALFGKTVVAIAAGGAHNLVLCSDGTLASWGLNNSGQLGDNSTIQRNLPVAVNMGTNSALYGKTVIAIAAGSDHSLALCSDGTVASWGYNGYGELGDNTTVERHLPVAVSTATNSALYGKTVVAIAAGRTHSLALCSNGTVTAWGSNAAGLLGDNSKTQRNLPVAVNMGTNSALYGKTVVALAAGEAQSLALCSDGSMAAWGDNSAGQLGDNTTIQRNLPTAVNTTPLAAGQRFTRVAGNSNTSHTLALVAAPPTACEIVLTAAKTQTNGSFQFAYTNTLGAFFGVLATTNPALPFSNWTTLGDATEVSPGQFQFTDPQATNGPGRFYRIRSP